MRRSGATAALSSEHKKNVKSLSVLNSEQRVLRFSRIEPSTAAIRGAMLPARDPCKPAWRARAKQVNHVGAQPDAQRRVPITTNPHRC